MSTETQVKTNEKKGLEGIIALWKSKSKDGKTTYLSGKKHIGFYNTNKKNPKEPDLRIVEKTEDGDLMKEVYLALWCNLSKAGKKYLTGKLDGKRVIGFINEEENSKKPYVKIYFAEEGEGTEEPKYVQHYDNDEPAEEFKIEEEDLPF